MKQFIILIGILFNITLNAQDTLTVNNLQKTDEVLSTVIQKALVLAEQTGEFVIEQAPMLLQEFYMWHTASHIFWIIFGLLIIFAGYRIPLMFSDQREKTNYYDQKYFSRYFYDASLPYIIFIISSIIGIATICTHLYYLIFILLAPKLYIIEYFINR
jgi:hypothetical protein